MLKTIATLTALLLVATSGPAVAASKRDPAADAYERARGSYFALKSDAARRKFRHNWLNVVRRFEAVAKKYPKSERAPDALYTAGDLLSDLSRISMLDEDLQAAITDFSRLIDKYPKDNLADDAALALARIHVDRTGDTEQARKILDAALKRPRGDVHAKLVAVRKTLPAKPAPRAVGKRIEARPQVAKAEDADGHADQDRRADDKKDARAQARAERRSDKRDEARADTRGDDHDDARADASDSADEGSPDPRGDKAISQSLLDALAKVSPPNPARDEAAQKSDADPKPASARAEKADDKKVAARPRNPAEAKRAAARLESAVGSTSADEATIAQQLGLKVRRVIIDAGHGGHDTGAIGKKGTREKDITLKLAKRVGALLADQGLEVILTRDDDTFVRLQDRTRIANEAKGDLFISIHCNASENRKVHGIETYTLNVASDRYSIRLAARENAASEKSISDLQFILADLATKANTEESERLAKRIQGSLVGSLRPKWSKIKDFGTKQALFYVLLGAKMPAVLVETSFISNLEEEKRLSSKKYQEDLAQAIVHGVQSFLEARERLARVD